LYRCWRHGGKFEKNDINAMYCLINMKCAELGIVVRQHYEKADGKRIFE